MHVKIKFDSYILEWDSCDELLNWTEYYSEKNELVARYLVATGMKTHQGFRKNLFRWPYSEKKKIDTTPNWLVLARQQYANFKNTRMGK